MSESQSTYTFTSAFRRSHARPRSDDCDDTDGDGMPREPLRDAAEALYRALGDGHEEKSKDDLADLTPQEEVLLLHVLE